MVRRNMFGDLLKRDQNLCVTPKYVNGGCPLVDVRNTLSGFCVGRCMQAKHHPDLIMCRKLPGIAIGRLCEKCEPRPKCTTSKEGSPSARLTHTQISSACHRRRPVRDLR